MIDSFPFTNFRIDARKYLNPLKDQVLALHFMGQLNTNDPQFNMLALMGSSRDMRGYYKGRYRDRQYLTFQAEYRVPVWKLFGFVLFAGVGDVAYSLNDFRLNTLKPTYGGGFRFKIGQRIAALRRYQAADRQMPVSEPLALMAAVFD